MNGPRMNGPRMNGREDNLTRRRTWFRYFPEGTLEFLLVTRVLALLLLAGLTVVRGSQRPAVLLVLGVILLLDYLLVLWWGIQLVTDLRDAASPGSMNAQEARQYRLRSLLIVMLPSIAATLVLTPWPEFFIADPVARERLTGIIIPLFALVYLATLFPAWKRLSSLGCGHPVWSALFLIPGLHWLALHRLIGEWQARLDRQLASARLPADPPSHSGLLFSDVAWFLTMLMVGTLLYLSFSGRAAQLLTLAHIASAGLAPLFAIGEVALMENVQRRYLAMLQVEQEGAEAK